MPSEAKRTAVDRTLPVDKPHVPHVGMNVGGRYRLVARRGRGGIGEVWEARQLDGDRPAAIKLLLPGWQTDDNVRRRFIREGRLASTMQHRHIVDILEVGESRGGQPFIAMELLRGPSLDVLMQRAGPLPWDRVKRILLQLCGALDHAHGLKIVHRDVKPSNIMLCNEPGQLERCKLVDFGIAKQRLLHMQTQQLTGEGQMLGSPGFMSPEQLQGRPTGIASDIYGLGCTGFYLLMGQVPFAGRSMPEMIHNALYGEPRRLDGLDLPRTVLQDVEAIFHRAVHRDPEQRFGSVLDFVVALNHVGSGSIAPARKRWTASMEAVSSSPRTGTSEFPRVEAERNEPETSRPTAEPPKGGARLPSDAAPTRKEVSGSSFRDEPSGSFARNEPSASSSGSFFRDEPSGSFARNEPSASSSGSFFRDEPSGSFARSEPSASSSGSFFRDEPSGSFARDEPSASSSGSFFRDEPSGSFARDEPSGSFFRDEPSGSFARDEPSASSSGSFFRDEPSGSFARDEPSASSSGVFARASEIPTQRGATAPTPTNPGSTSSTTSASNSGSTASTTSETSPGSVRRGVIATHSRSLVLTGRSTTDQVGWSGPDGFVDLARVPPDIVVVHMSGQIGAKSTWLFEQHLVSLLMRHRPVHLFWHLGTLKSYPSEVRDASLRCLTEHRDCIGSIHVLNSPGLAGMSLSVAAVAIGGRPHVYEDQVAWRMALDSCAFRRG